MLALLLAVGVYSAGPITTKFGPLASAAAHAESDDDSAGLVYGDDNSTGDKGARASDDDSNEGNEDSDDVGIVGSSTGPIFDENATGSPNCKTLHTPLVQGRCSLPMLDALRRAVRVRSERNRGLTTC